MPTIKDRAILSVSILKRAGALRPRPSVKALNNACRAAIACLVLTSSMAGAAEASLEGKWKIQSIKNVDSFDSSKAEIVVTDDGAFAMTIGCNRLRGKPRIEDSSIAFESVATTLMACPPPLDRTEETFRAALEAVSAFDLDPSREVLTFSNTSGEVLITLSRME